MNPTSKQHRFFILLALMLTAGSSICAAEDVFDRPASRQQPIGGQQEQIILPVDEAFRLGVVPTETGASIFWQVAPGHFLYRDKISFLADGESLSVPLPEGIFINDETFGYVEVLDGLVSIDIGGDPESVSVHYQGCAAQGFCYPPQKVLITSGKISENSEKSPY